jgi:hypothetical protein
MLRRREDIETRLAKIRAKEKAQRAKYLRGDSGPKRRRTDLKQSSGAEQDEEQFVLDEYDSDGEKSSSGNDGGLSAATLELMEKLGMTIGAPKEDDEEAEDELKVGRKLSDLRHLSNFWRSSSVLEPTRSLHSSSTNSAASSSRQQSRRKSRTRTILKLKT